MSDSLFKPEIYEFSEERGVAQALDVKAEKDPLFVETNVWIRGQGRASVSVSCSRGSDLS